MFIRECISLGEYDGSERMVPVIVVIHLYNIKLYSYLCVKRGSAVYARLSVVRVVQVKQFAEHTLEVLIFASAV